VASLGGLLDPLDVLIAEHRAFRARTRAFLESVRSAGGARGTPPSVEPRQVAGFAEFLERDVDQRHGRKEEEGLFPVLSRYIPAEGGPVAVLVAEHDSLRSHQRVIAQAGARLASDPGASESFQRLLWEADVVHGFLDSHIEKEETVLFPLAREVLTRRDLDEVREGCARVDERFGTVEVPVDPPTTSTGARLPPFCAAGRARKDQATRA
jgi:hemerythrin-like domain-containing protein